MTRPAAVLVCLLDLLCPVAFPLVATALVATPGEARASDRDDALARRTLDAAIMLAGLTLVPLPLVLTAEAHPHASPGADAWTTFDDAGRAQQIFVYTKGAAFQCANKRHMAPFECRLKLASVLVHEAWHYKYGRGEDRAYQAQLAFLNAHAGSGPVITGVRRARAAVLAKAARPQPAMAITPAPAAAEPAQVAAVLQPYR